MSVQGLRGLVTCTGCGHVGAYSDFQVRILSIMYRWKRNAIESLERLTCPACWGLAVIYLKRLTTA